LKITPRGAGQLVLAALLLPPSSNPQSGPGASNSVRTPQSNKLERVHARKLDGFELSPQPTATGTQIGGSEVTETSLKYPSDGPRQLKPGGDYFCTVGPLRHDAGAAADPAELIIVARDQRSDLTEHIESTRRDSPTRADQKILLVSAELYDQLPQTQIPADQERRKAEALQR